jgi:hypothetical protein
MSCEQAAQVTGGLHKMLLRGFKNTGIWISNTQQDEHCGLEVSVTRDSQLLNEFANLRTEGWQSSDSPVLAQRISLPRIPKIPFPLIGCGCITKMDGS